MTKCAKYMYFHVHSFLTLKTSNSSSKSSSMLFQLSLGTLITFSTVPLSEISHTQPLNNVIIFLFNPRVRNDYCSFTCANEHDIVLSISSIDSVHSDLCKAVVHIGPDEDGPSAHRVDRVVH